MGVCADVPDTSDDVADHARFAAKLAANVNARRRRAKRIGIDHVIQGEVSSDGMTICV